jgi:hypothetical protein
MRRYKGEASSEMRPKSFAATGEASAGVGAISTMLPLLGIVSLFAFSIGDLGAALEICRLSDRKVHYVIIITYQVEGAHFGSRQNSDGRCH